MSYRRTLTAGLVVLATVATGLLLLSGLGTSRAVQNPSLSFDMATAGNTYDETTNTMTVGSIQNCLTTAAPGNNFQHLHPTHLIIQNVEDLVGWQARLNYDGSRMRPSTVGFTPFTDNNTGQTISFLNLPLDQLTGVHRDQVIATDIPPAAPGPQTALIGSVYQGEQSFPISPDTPAKTTPDDASYNAPSGGILASVNLQVLAGNAGNPSLFVNLDDANPNGPGSDLQIFTGTGLTTVSVPVNQLGDGYHGEGATCVAGDCVTQECPPGPNPPTPNPNDCRSWTPGPTASPTPFPTPPWMPQSFHLLCQTENQAMSDLHINVGSGVSRPSNQNPVTQNPAGCPAPSYVYGPPFPPAYGSIDIDWGVTCVDPGDYVRLMFQANCTTPEPGCGPPNVSCYHWTILGSPINPCPTPTPGSPTPPPTPTPTASPTATPCPGCTLTPTPTITPTAAPTPTAAAGRTFVINTTADGADANPGDGLCRTSVSTCTLDAAIQEADAVSGRDTINFSIGSGVQRIPQTAIGNVYTAHDSLIIDGSTQPGFAGTPLIEIDGLGRPGGGLRIQGASDSTIREVAIVNSGFFGIYSSGPNNVFEGNYIGQRIDGTAAGNLEGGVFLLERNSTVRDNVIANNGGGSNNDGVFIAGTGHRITRNVIFNNVGLGIDLDPDGVTPNDNQDPDTGANNLQNFPFISSAVLNDIIPQTMSIQGNLNSTPNTTFQLEFFHDENRPCNPAIVEGGVFIGMHNVTTDGSGNASFSVQFTLGPGPHGAGSVSATATDPGGNTSEFSQCAQVGSSPATPTPTSPFTPSPTPTPTPTCCTPTPTATATATATPTATASCPGGIGTFVDSYTNTLSQAASDLHIEYEGGFPVSACNVSSPAGCPAPSVTSGPGSVINFDWGTACVDPGETVSFRVRHVFAHNPCTLSSQWTLFGAPIGSAGPGVRQPSGCGLGTPTPTATRTATATASPTASPTPGTVTPTPTATATASPIASSSPFTPPPSFTPPATPTPTPSPLTGHDARLTRISGVPKNVRLSPGEVIADSASVVVANESNHSETIGVYVDVMAPSGCTPNGRVLQTTVTLNAGAKTTVSVPVSYSCSDPSAANGQSYAWTAVADHGGDDLPSCPPGSLQGLACFNALADDDADPADNRKARTGPKVVAQ